MGKLFAVSVNSKNNHGPRANYEVMSSIDSTRLAATCLLKYLYEDVHLMENAKLATSVQLGQPHHHLFHRKETERAERRVQIAVKQQQLLVVV